MAPIDYNTDDGTPRMQSIDYSESDQHDQDEYDKSIAKGGVTTPFPWKLHDMLDDMDRQGTHSVVTWQPHGRAFMVHKPKDFVDKIMKHYFNQTKYASFQRQLNLYGFSRLSHGKDKGAYYHMCFVRGERGLCRSMIRQKIKGTKVRRTLAPEEEPNFYLPQWGKTKIVEMTGVSLHPTPVKSTTASSKPKPRTPSSQTKAAKNTKKSSPAVNNSLVSMIREAPTQAGKTLLPPPPVIKQLQPSGPISSEVEPQPPSYDPARGGDLLFFEGRPFRYLEHIEQIPPLQSQGPRQSYKERLHNMINSIVMESPSWQDAGQHNQMCSV